MQAYQDATFLSTAGTPFSFGNGTYNYFWTSNYAGSMWTTNGLPRVAATEPGSVNGILFWNGTPGVSGASGGWSIHQPPIYIVGATTTYLNGALIILPYKGNLIALNTIEGNQNGITNSQTFSNRARWCQLGNPYLMNAVNYVPPNPFNGVATDNNAWRSDIPGRGNFADADTSERIVSAEIVQDVLIVFFERSTWRLTYRGDPIQPFQWDRLSTNYGAESTFSNVGFDDSALAFSRYGWIGSTTNETFRIDQNIPDQSFSVEAANSNFQGLSRVQGIRDFFRQMAYWTFPPISQEEDTQIYAYNYLDKSWSIFTPSNQIQVFGTYYANNDTTWATLSQPSNIWSNYTNTTWADLGTGANNGFPFIIGGDVDGNIFKMFEFTGEASTTDNGTPFNFNILTKTFNPYFNEGHKCRLGYVDIYFTTQPGGQITLNHYVDDMFTPVFTRIVNMFPVGVYDISTITPGVTTVITTTLQHNIEIGDAVNISSIVGSIGNTLNNTAPVATVVTTTTITIAVNTSGLVYTQGGYLWNAQQEWEGEATYKRVYLGAIGHTHQLQLTLSNEQMADLNAYTAQPEIQALVLWTRKQGLIRG